MFLFRVLQVLWYTTAVVIVLQNRISMTGCKSHHYTAVIRVNPAPTPPSLPNYALATKYSFLNRLYLCIMYTVYEMCATLVILQTSTNCCGVCGRRARRTSKRPGRCCRWWRPESTRTCSTTSARLRSGCGNGYARS